MKKTKTDPAAVATAELGLPSELDPRKLGVVSHIPLLETNRYQAANQ